MYAEITGLTQGVKVIYDLVTAITSTTKNQAILVAVTDVQFKLTDAMAVAIQSQEAQSKNLARIRELEAELDKIAKWETEAARYVLQEVPSGKLVYSLRPELANGEPAHMLCANCFVKRQKAFLQVRGREDGGALYDCQNCKIMISTYNPSVTMAARNITNSRI